MNQPHTTLLAPNSSFSFTIQDTHASMRLDTYITQQFPLYSRSFFNDLIHKGHITINNRVTLKSGTKIKINDTIIISLPPERSIEPAPLNYVNTTIDILYQHEHFFVLNKPAGLLVHAPSPKSTAFTLVDWLLTIDNTIQSVGAIDRPGIVHRLDKDTSGVIIVPRTNYAHTQFGTLFRDRAINKTYYALVKGHPARHGTIETPIGRDPINKTKMACFSIFTHTAGPIRHAMTHYTVETYLQEHTFLEVKPVTGRTHQIRVHLASIGHAIEGDTVYGKSSLLIQRQALHAGAISFIFDNIPYHITAPLPDDIHNLYTTLPRAPMY